MAPEWYHFHCFWIYAQYHDVKELNINGFNGLRWKDQEEIRKMIKGGREALENIEVKGNYNEYSVEYAKSGRSGCRNCPGQHLATRIPKGDMRLSRLDYDNEGSALYGPQKWWYCVKCFVTMKIKLGFAAGMDPKKIPGFSDLKEQDQTSLLEQFKKGASKRKADDDPGEGPSKAKKPHINETEKERTLREQNEMFWKIRDDLKKNISADVMKQILLHNNQVVPKKKSNVLDLLSDCMMFGAFGSCTNCGGRNFMFSEAESQYLCVGVGADNEPCNTKTQEVAREEFKIPGECRDIEYLKDYRYIPRKRVFLQTSVNLTPLIGMRFVIGNKTHGMKKVIASQLESMGAKVVNKPQLGLSACISSKDEFQSKHSRIIQACKALKIPVVSERYLVTCKNGEASLIMKAHTFKADE